MNSILNRILLINSFQNPRLKSILAASNWDTSKGPKVGASVFPGQDNEILLKLMQLVPYMTYDNFISALKAKSRLNHEKTKNELYEFFEKIYNDLEVQAHQKNTDIVENDNYSVDDIDALDFAIQRQRRNENKEYNEEVQRLNDNLKEINKNIAEKRKILANITSELDDITAQIDKINNPNATSNNNINDIDKNNIDSDEFATKFARELSKLKLKDSDNDPFAEENDDETYSEDIFETQEKLTKQLKKIHDSGDKSPEAQKQRQSLENILRLINRLIIKREQLIKKQFKISQTDMSELRGKRKKIITKLNKLREEGDPFSKRIDSTLLLDTDDDNNIFDTHITNNGKKDEFIEQISEIREERNNIETQIKEIIKNSNLLASGRKNLIPEDQLRTMKEYTQMKEDLEKQKSNSIQKELEIKRERETKRRQDIRTLINKLINNGLYEQYCPYAYACEFIQNKCGTITNISDTIKVNQSPSYQYNKSQEFQQALNILANAMPSIYREVVDDIYDKYSKYPAFNKDFDPADYQYNNIQVVTYKPTNTGEGNYSYDAENKTYVYDTNGNFTREIKPLNAHTQISIQMPMKRYDYDESTKKYKLNPQGDYIYVPAQYKYSYDSATNQYKQNSSGDYIKLPSGEYQKISNGSFHKISKDVYTRTTVLENNNNFRHQLEQSFGNNTYTFQKVKSGEKGNYKYNAATKRYEYAPEGGDFIRVQSNNSSSKNDTYFADGRILSLTRQLVKKQYYNKNGYIDPIIVTYLREKYTDEKDTQENVGHFLYDLKKYIKWITMIDDADPDKDIIDDQWKIKLENLNSQFQDNKLTLALIGKYITTNSSESLNEQLYNRHMSNINRVNNTMNSNPTTNMKIIAKYDYDVYKNFHKKIDPIMIAWVTYCHKYYAQRDNWNKQLNENQQKLIKIKQDFSNRIQNLKSNIITDINNLPINSSISETEKKRFIRQMLGIDMASIQMNTIDKDYKLAQIQQLHNNYKEEFEKLFESFDKAKDELYQFISIDRITKLNKIVNAFIDHVNFFGDMLEEISDNDKLGVTRKLIENPIKWQTILNRMATVLQAHINEKSYKNFNTAYCIDLLENMINQYGGAKNDYNPINTENYKDIPELNIRWTRANITYELNKIFESEMARLRF